MPSFAIPTFTVTINPLESNEMTYVPGSPPYIDEQSSLAALEHQPLLAITCENPQQQNSQQLPLVTANGSNLQQKPSQKTIANTTIIVDDEVNKKLLGASEVQYCPLKH